MSSINIILKNLKNLLPYFLLIAIYFFFVNLVTKTDKNFDKSIEKKSDLPDETSRRNNNQIRLKIPVMPYNQ